MSNPTEKLAAELAELASQGSALIHIQSGAYICQKLAEAASLLRSQQPDHFDGAGKMVAPGKMKVFAIVGPAGLAYVGLHEDEASAWSTHLGWPSAEEIANAKSQGFYCAEVNITRRKP